MGHHAVPVSRYTGWAILRHCASNKYDCGQPLRSGDPVDTHDLGQEPAFGYGGVVRADAAEQTGHVGSLAHNCIEESISTKTSSWIPYDT
jgi:hypothetical protein